MSERNHILHSIYYHSHPPHSTSKHFIIMKFPALLTVTALFIVSSVNAVVLTPEARANPTMTQQAAENQLIPHNIITSSSGGCTNKNNPTCTSYDGIRQNTVQYLIILKDAVGLSQMVVTGGTETGHASGTYSHANGYKADIRHQSQLDSYIKNTFRKIGNRGDGYPQWEAGSGNLYCDEGSHWDITFLGTP